MFENTRLKLQSDPLRKTTSIREIIKRDFWLYMMFLPGLLYYLIFRMAPIVGAFILSFKRYEVAVGVLNSPWIGFEHFRQFVDSIYFGRLLRNTLMINGYSLLFGFTAPIILALLINEVAGRRFKKIVQTITYLPNFISIVVVVSMVITFLSPTNGIVNQFIQACGGRKINFLADSKYFWSIFTMMNIWQTTGFGAIIYLASLSGIPNELYEAATVDGAGRWKQLWHVTLPGLSTTIVILLLMRIGHLLEVGYESIILLYNPSIYETADVINTYVYRRGMLNADYSFASAVGLFQATLGFIMVIVANKLARRYSESSLW